MAVVKFSDLPDNARIWIYGAQNCLDEAQINRLETHMGQFLKEWNSHQNPVVPAWKLQQSRFVIIGVDESSSALSGCSIDSMVRNLKTFDSVTGLNFLGTSSLIFYKDHNDSIQCIDRPGFAELVREDVVNDHTVVFNNVIRTVGEFRNGKWEVPMRDSWHMNVFGKLLAQSS